MSYRFFGTLIVVTIIAQIAFSFYYSSEIITQNNLLDQNQTQINLLEKENSELEKNLAVLTSMTNLKKQMENQTYQTIKQTLNLTLSP